MKSRTAKVTCNRLARPMKMIVRLGKKHAVDHHFECRGQKRHAFCIDMMIVHDRALFNLTGSHTWGNFDCQARLWWLLATQIARRFFLIVGVNNFMLFANSVDWYPRPCVIHECWAMLRLSLLYDQTFAQQPKSTPNVWQKFIDCQSSRQAIS